MREDSNGNNILGTPRGCAVEGADAQFIERGVLPSERIQAMVCGRGERRRNGMLIAMISRAYMDESGDGNGKSKHFVIAGYVATADLWTRFSKDWQDVLDEDPKLPPFHMVPFWQGEEGFEVLKTHDERKARLFKLIQVIAKYKPVAFVFDLEWKYWEENCRTIFPKKGKLKVNRNPYFYLARQVAVRFGLGAKHLFNADGTVDLVFDWHQECNRAVRDYIEDELRPLVDNDLRTRGTLGQIYYPRKEERGEHAPLQAADILASQSRRAIESPRKFQEIINQWLCEASAPLRYNLSKREINRSLTAQFGFIHPDYESILTKDGKMPSAEEVQQTFELVLRKKMEDDAKL